MASRKEGVQFGPDRSGLEDSFSGRPVSDFPVKNVIALFWAIFPEDRCIGIKRPMRIHQDRKIIIVDFDQFSSVGRCITIFGHDERDFLGLK